MEAGNAMNGIVELYHTILQSYLLAINTAGFCKSDFFLDSKLGWEYRAHSAIRLHRHSEVIPSLVERVWNIQVNNKRRDSLSR